MTGFEAVAVAAGHAALPGVTRATTAIATKLSESVLFRWRVRRKVRSAVDFHVPPKEFRLWLRHIEVRDLMQPVEQAGPSLAVDLDSALGANVAWSAHPKRHSRALDLVEQTYLAMAALAPRANATALKESWASGRHRALVEQLTAIVGPTIQLERGDLADLLEDQSNARSAARRAPFNVEPSRLSEALESVRQDLPTVGSGRPTVVIGPFGAGKSELAEQWFRAKVDSYRRDPLAPRPVWLRASELLTRSLEAEIQRVTGAHVTSTTSIAIVIDGLDEVDGPAAARIMFHATELTNLSASAQVLATCRPGVLPEDDSDVHHAGLSEPAALALVAAVAGSDHAAWGWDPSLTDAFRRPFFAITAGLLVGQGERPTGQADLISKLVTRALSTPTSSSTAVHDQATYALLTKMAVSATTSGNRRDGLNFQERQQVLRTTLVHRVGERVEFSLPILQQWFAGNAALNNTSLVSEAVAEAASFDRWRWALAVACLAADPGTLDDILEICISGNPGAGAWVLAQVATGHRGFRADNDEELDPADASHRILRATRTWVSALGPLAPALLPVHRATDPIGLGVRVSKRNVAVAFSRTPVQTDTVEQLPEVVHPLTGTDERWHGIYAGRAPEGEEWPWRQGRDRVASNVLRVLNSHPLVGGRGGIWELESRYRTLRLVLNERSLLYPPIDRMSAIERIRDNLDRYDDPASVAWVTAANSYVSGTEILDLAKWLDSDSAETVQRPLPTPDRSTPATGRSMVWDFYSDHRLLEFCAESLGNGCAAYDEAARGLFRQFDWSLGTGEPGSFGVLGELAYQASGDLGRTPVINQAVLPLNLLEHVVHDWGDAFLFSRNKRAAVALVSDPIESDRRFFERIRTMLERESTAPEFGAFRRTARWTGSIVDVNSPRPSSLIAAKWIWNDLKALDLAKGTFPQLV